MSEPLRDTGPVASPATCVPPVVVLLDHRTASWIPLHRATRLSNALGARLVVVLVVPETTLAMHPALVIRHIADLLFVRSPRHGHDLEVVRGSVANDGTAVIRELAPSLVVVSMHHSDDACRLADELSLPVLVARDIRTGGKWIAASDMRNLAFPVLAYARGLAGTVGRELLYFHNAPPVSVFTSDPMATDGSYTAMLQLQDDAAAAKRMRLDRLAHEDHGQCVVTRSDDTAHALLEIARARDADVVVVGHRRRSRIGRFFGHHTAERVAKHSQRGVLVVPLDRSI